MLEGRYKVIKEIHIYDCDLGQLKIPEGKIIELRGCELVGIVDGIRFPSRLLSVCDENLLRIYDPT